MNLMKHQDVESHGDISGMKVVMQILRVVSGGGLAKVQAGGDKIGQGVSTLSILLKSLHELLLCFLPSPHSHVAHCTAIQQASLHSKTTCLVELCKTLGR